MVAGLIVELVRRFVAGDVTLIALLVGDVITLTEVVIVVDGVVGVVARTVAGGAELEYFIVYG